ncbi:MAG: ankyrin repeat domain-containing protein [Phycisphaeraceae bacterium]
MATQHPSDALFNQAIAAIDRGDPRKLADLIDVHPGLVHHRTDWHDAPCGGYFREPYLMWFVAENPIRNRKLPANIAVVTQTIIDAAKRHKVTKLKEQLGYTLALVVSGCVARECGVQRALIDVLVDAGADPNCMEPALSHREIDAVERLIERGAAVTLSVAAATGRMVQLRQLLPDATDDQRLAALAFAAVNAQPDACRLLLEQGVNPSRYNPQYCHPHSTPLHQAVWTGSLAAVQAMVTHGADLTMRDRVHNATPLGWAEHGGRHEIAAYLREKGGEV